MEDPPREPPPARFVEALSRGARGPNLPSRASDHTHGAPKLATSDQPVLALALDDAPSLRSLTPDALAAVQGASLCVLAETEVAVGSPTVRARLAAELDRIVAAFAAEARVG